MIVTLEGIVSEKLTDVVVLNVNGVGYGLLVPHETQASLRQSETAKLFIYEHIRETAHDLFGFQSFQDKQFFELLLSVTGVGPKMALSIMNIGSVASVRAAIAAGEVKIIQQASGVGKRVAERIVVDLKDKVGLEGVDLAATGLLYGDAIANQDDAAQGLIALGYSPQDAIAALNDIDTSLPTEERIRMALKERR